MKINPRYASLLDYQWIQKLAERYYKYKIKQPCFLMKQNNHWTIVTYTN